METRNAPRNVPVDIVGVLCLCASMARSRQSVRWCATAFRLRSRHRRGSRERHLFGVDAQDGAPCLRLRESARHCFASRMCWVRAVSDNSAPIPQRGGARRALDRGWYTTATLYVAGLQGLQSAGPSPTSKFGSAVSNGAGCTAFLPVRRFRTTLGDFCLNFTARCSELAPEGPKRVAPPDVYRESIQGVLHGQLEVRSSPNTVRSALSRDSVGDVSFRLRMSRGRRFSGARADPPDGRGTSNTWLSSQTRSRTERKGLRPTPSLERLCRSTKLWPVDRRPLEPDIL